MPRGITQLYMCLSENRGFANIKESIVSLLGACQSTAVNLTFQVLFCFIESVDSLLI